MCFKQFTKTKNEQKLKKVFTLLFLLTISLAVFGQTLSEKEIYGKWKVEKIINKPTNPQFITLIDGFENATFYFNENGNFKLTTTSKSKLFDLMKFVI